MVPCTNIYFKILTTTTDYGFELFQENCPSFIGIIVVVIVILIIVTIIVMILIIII